MSALPATFFTEIEPEKEAVHQAGAASRWTYCRPGDLRVCPLHLRCLAQHDDLDAPAPEAVRQRAVPWPPCGKACRGAATDAAKGAT